MSNVIPFPKASEKPAHDELDDFIDALVRVVERPTTEQRQRIAEGQARLRALLEQEPTA